MLYWLPAIVFLLHCAEEFPRFPAWATRHFGITSRPYYVYSHIPLVSGILVTAFLASAAPPGTTWPLLATAGQAILFTNGLFHLVTTLLFREYSPGVITGTLLFFPSTAYLFHRTFTEHLLESSQIVWAIGLGTVLGGLVIASLWLPMDLDWDLRRGRRS